VQFTANSDTATVVGMSLSLTGAWSPHAICTTRTKLAVAVARRVYSRLRKAGYVPY